MLDPTAPSPCRTGNFGTKLGKVLIPNYKRWAVLNLVLATSFTLLTVVVEGLLYHGLPTEWVRSNSVAISIARFGQNWRKYPIISKI